jgi:hypothetical protein
MAGHRYEHDDTKHITIIHEANAYDESQIV